MLDTPYASASREAGEALRLLRPEPANWIPESDFDHDVVVVGGGQSGVGIAFALRLQGITRVRVIDAAPRDEVGVWTTIARMRTLRTAKTLRGHDFGIPQLTFRFWYTRVYGEQVYEEMGRIPRTIWQDYLDWYRAVVGVKVDYQHRLVGVQPRDTGMTLDIATQGGMISVSTRKLVLANGVDGLGVPNFPAPVRRVVPEHLRFHTADRIDFGPLTGRRIAVIGAAASAFDAASVALETGAAWVHQLCRSPKLADKLNLPEHWASDPAQAFFFDYPDDVRWKFVSVGRRRGFAPPETIRRACDHDNHTMLFNVVLDGLSMEGDTIVLEHEGQRLEFEYMIAGTGYRIDIALKPELAAAAPHVKLWRHAIGPEAASVSPDWAAFPYLGGGFQFRQAELGAAPWVENIHAYNYAAMLSHGVHVGDVASAVIGVPRLVQGIAADFYAENPLACISRSPLYLD